MLTGATVASAVADIELTQHCISRDTCHEGNPLLLSGRKQMYAVALPIAVGISYLGHRMHKRGSKNWWAPQVAVIAGHSIGIGFNLRFVW